MIKKMIRKMIMTKKMMAKMEKMMKVIELKKIKFSFKKKIVFFSRR